MLCSSPVFLGMDTIMGSETFYNTVLNLFKDIEEREEVNDLQTWWNRSVFNWLPSTYVQLIIYTHSQIFPNYSAARRPVSKNSALARIKQRRLEINGVDLAREA